MDKTTYDYDNYTYNSKNPIARFSHRKRLRTAIQLTSDNEIESLLDYGCGDGKFLLEMKSYRPRLKTIGYDPLSESEEVNKIKIFKNLEDIGSYKFDLITCFEVLEHFNSKNQKEILFQMKSMLKKYGQIIISVPIEIRFPSLIKNIRRLTLSRGKYHTIKNTFKCLLEIPVPEVRDLDGFIPSHIGFNHKIFEKEINEYFIIKSKIYSPFPLLGYNLNSQVFYKLEIRT